MEGKYLKKVKKKEKEINLMTNSIIEEKMIIASKARGKDSKKERRSQES